MDYIIWISILESSEHWIIQLEKIQYLRKEGRKQAGDLGRDYSPFYQKNQFEIFHHKSDHQDNEAM